MTYNFSVCKFYVEYFPHFLLLNEYWDVIIIQPIPVTVRSKAYVSSCSIAAVAGSNPAEVMAVRLICLFYCVGSYLCDELFTFQGSPVGCIFNCVLSVSLNNARVGFSNGQESLVLPPLVLHVLLFIPPQWLRFQ